MMNDNYITNLMFISYLFYQRLSLKSCLYLKLTDAMMLYV